VVDLLGEVRTPHLEDVEVAVVGPPRRTRHPDRRHERAESEQPHPDVNLDPRARPSSVRSRERLGFGGRPGDARQPRIGLDEHRRDRAGV